MATLRYLLDVQSNAAKTFEALAARIDELDRKLKATREVHVKSADAQAKIAALGVQAGRLRDRLSDMPVSLRGAAETEAKLLALEVSADRLRDKLGAGGIGGLLGRLGGILPSGADLGSAGLGVLASPLLPAAVLEVTGLASGLAAATLGVGAFGALAIPVYQQVTAAIQATSTAQAAYDKAAALEKDAPTKAHAQAAALALKQLQQVEKGQPPLVKAIIGGIGDLTSKYQAMSNALQPDFLKVFNDALRVAASLLPDLMPFARAAAPAIEGLLNDAAKFTASKGFADWIKQMSSISGPAITAIGKGLGEDAVAAGKLLTIMSSKDDVTAINALFRSIAFVLELVGGAIELNMKAWDRLDSHLKSDVSFFKHTARDFETAWDDSFAFVRHVIDDFENDWRRVELAVLSGEQHFLDAMSHIPIVGHYFHTAADDVAREAQRIRDSMNSTGSTAQSASGKVNSLTQAIDDIPSFKALRLEMTGSGSFTIQQQAAIASANIAKTRGQAYGGYIAGPGGPTSDIIPALLSNGEYVMKAAAVARYGRHTMDAINAERFASGGLVLRGNTSVLSGQYALNSYNAFSSSMVAAMERGMRGYAFGGLVTDDPFMAGQSLGSLPPSTPVDFTPGRSGPLFTINGDLVVRDDADIAILSQRLSSYVNLSGGVR